MERTLSSVIATARDEAAYINLQSRRIAASDFLDSTRHRDLARQVSDLEFLADTMHEAKGDYSYLESSQPESHATDLAVAYRRLLEDEEPQAQIDNFNSALAALAAYPLLDSVQQRQLASFCTLWAGYLSGPNPDLFIPGVEIDSSFASMIASTGIDYDQVVQTSPQELEVLGL